MKVTGDSQATGARDVAPDRTQAKPRTRFSEVLKEEMQPASPVPPAFVPPMPLFDAAAVDSGQPVAQPEVVLASLVQEIAVEAPPGGSASVEIQFDSRTLEGLHVRVQKSDGSVEVQLSTSSEAVSRLLTANADRLAEALVQRGYVSPVVSVQRSRRSGRDGSRGTKRKRR